MLDKILEYKQIIHIVVEVILLVAITVYFYQKNKRILGHLKDIVQRLDDQEDLIQKHETLLQKVLTERIDKVPSLKEQKINVKSEPTNILPSPVLPKAEKPPKPEILHKTLFTPSPQLKHISKLRPLTPIPDISLPPPTILSTFTINSPPVKASSRVEEINDENLDEELKIELEEMKKV